MNCGLPLSRRGVRRRFVFTIKTDLFITEWVSINCMKLHNGQYFLLKTSHWERKTKQVTYKPLRKIMFYEQIYTTRARKFCIKKCIKLNYHIMPKLDTPIGLFFSKNVSFTVCVCLRQHSLLLHNQRISYQNF